MNKEVDNIHKRQKAEKADIFLFKMGRYIFKDIDELIIYRHTVLKKTEKKNM